MILSKFDCGNLSGSDSNLSNGELLHDIQEISNALYVERKTHNSSLVSSSSLCPNLGIEPCIYNSKSKSKLGFYGEGEMSRENHKPSSIWGWKPLKALSHIRQKKFACYFFCHVHCVENLSSDFDGICMSVHLKKKDNVLRTRPSRVSSGTVEFEETLMSRCTVYGSKNGPGNFMKYEPKHFLLCVSIIGFEGFDFGKHWVDLTRLLPLTLEELEKDKCSGKWSTSFKLEGKARGATLHVSFGFLVTKDSLAELGGNIRLPLVLNLEQNRLSRTSFAADCVSLSKGNTSLRRAGSVPSSLTDASSNSHQCLDVKFGWPKDVSDFSNSIDKLYGKLEEKGIDNPVKVDLAGENPKSLKVTTESLTDSEKELSESRHDEEKEFGSNSTSEVETRLYDSTIRDLDVSMVEVIDVAEIFKGNEISSDDDAKPNIEEVSDSLENDLLLETGGFLETAELTEFEQLMDKLSDELKVNYTNKEGPLEIQECVEPANDLMTGEFKVSCIDKESLLDIQKSPKLEPSDDLMSGEFEKEDPLDIQKSPKLEPSPSDDFLSGEFIKGLFDIQNCQTLEPSYDLMPAEFKVNCIDMEGLLDDQKSPKVESSDHLMTGEFEVKHKGNKLVKSLSLDDVSKAVVEDFCNMWEESDPSTPRSTITLESPRERLLRQFEEDMMTTESLFLEDTILKEESEYGYELELELEHAAPSVSSMGYTVGSIDLSPLITKDTKNVNQASQSKIQAKTLEHLETQSLMERWGLDEDAFLNSPHYSNGGFGSPIFVPSESEEPVGLPPLGEGLDPLLQLKNGGLLRSMNPLLFKNAKNCGSLIMQASKLVVLPAELSSDFMEMLQCMASVGSERLSKKLCSLLPLDVLSGKIMQQLALEASYEAKTHSRRSSHTSAHHESEIKIQVKGPFHFPGDNSLSSSSSVSVGSPSECITTRDLSAMVLDTMEALTIEGLKVQSDMSTENAPSTIRIKPVPEPSDLSYVDGLLDLSISLDEWLRLDSGIFADENDIGDRTLNLLRAHHSKNLAEIDVLQNEPRKCGVLGDNLTLCLMIQLRDPLRNYEPVGIPMLGLIQMERVLSSPGSAAEINGNIESEKYDQQRVLTFTFKEVHLAGLSLELDHTESWASKRHQQSGSRWLISSGLTKKSDSHYSMSNSLVSSTTQVFRKRCSKSLLWSISRPVQRVDTQSQFSTWDLHGRNPDIIFP